MGGQDVFTLTSAAAITAANGIRLPAGHDGSVMYIRNMNPHNREMSIDQDKTLSRCSVGGTLLAGAQYELRYAGGPRGGSWSFVGSLPHNAIYNATQYRSIEESLVNPNTAISESAGTINTTRDTLQIGNSTRLTNVEIGTDATAKTLTIGNTTGTTDVIIQCGAVPSAGSGVSAAELLVWEVLPRYASSGITVTRCTIDLTGLVGSAAIDDIIGNTGAAPNAHIGQITAAIHGAVSHVTMKCLEVPTGGTADIDLYSATTAVGAQDEAIGNLIETQIIDSGGNYTIGEEKYGIAITANHYLYLTNGIGAAGGNFLSGRFLLTFYGV
jgi:hypothetical protein